MKIGRVFVLMLCVVVLQPSVGAAQQAAAQHGKMAGGKTSSAAFHQDIRKLWTDHAVWTRDYIIAAIADHPDAQAAVAKFYGAAAGQQLTTLLKEHITIAVDLIKAAKAGDKEGQQKADTRWQENATHIADFLAKANPNWPRATLVDLMKKHLSTTTDEVVARLNKNWDGDVRAFDAVYEHILMMSDALADGIVKQFPDKFGAMHGA